MFVCAKCGTEVSFGTVTFDAHGDPAASYCRPCRPSQVRDRAKSMFDGGFTLQNVLGDDRKPITVNSLKELRQVEKERNVALACMSDGDISQPPQHEPNAGMISRNRRPKFNRNPAAYSATEVAKASAASGIAKSADDTLANRPNPV